ncbi:sensor histidine kinase, partial [Cellulosimicrobium cellulans]
MPTDLPVPPGEARPAAGGALDVGVHATFLALVATSTTRYVVRHGADDRWQLVVVLAAVTVVAYGALLVASRRASSRSVPARAATLVLLATWSVLTLLAPSFAWCALPLFFVCRLAFRPPWSHVLVGEVAVVTSVALLRLSDGTDWAALVGPPCVAVLLTLVTDRVERDAAARVQLQEQIAQAQARPARGGPEAGLVGERAGPPRGNHPT